MLEKVENQAKQQKKGNTRSKETKKETLEARKQKKHRI